MEIVWLQCLDSTEVEGKKIKDLVKEGKIKKKNLDQIVEEQKKGSRNC